MKHSTMSGLRRVIFAEVRKSRQMTNAETQVLQAHEKLVELQSLLELLPITFLSEGFDDEAEHVENEILGKLDDIRSELDGIKHNVLQDAD